MVTHSHYTSTLLIFIPWFRPKNEKKASERIPLRFLYIFPNLLFFFSQAENRALRLKENAVATQDTEDSPGPVMQMALQSFETTDGRMNWNYFDESSYIAKGGLREGEDPYVRNRFNQEASDNLPSNREIPDTRNPM